MILNNHWNLSTRDASYFGLGRPPNSYKMNLNDIVHKYFGRKNKLEWYTIVIN